MTSAIILDLPVDDPRYTDHRHLLIKYREQYREHALLVKDLIENSTVQIFNDNWRSLRGNTQSLYIVMTAKISPIRDTGTGLSFYIPATMKKFNLQSNGQILAEFLCDDSPIVVEPPLEDILRESKEIPPSSDETLKLILAASQQSNPRLLFNRQYTITYDGILYIRRILVQPYLPVYRARYSDIELVSFCSNTIIVETMTLCSENRNTKSTNVIVCCVSPILLNPSSSLANTFPLIGIFNYIMYNISTASERDTLPINEECLALPNNADLLPILELPYSSLINGIHFIDEFN
jgi:hypothetical protein